MDISFTRDEKRFVLAEIIKSSNIDIDSLLAFINANHVTANWMNMQLPLGRNMKQCMQVIEQMGGESPIPKGTFTSSKDEIVPKWYDLSVTGDVAGSNVHKRTPPSSNSAVAILPRVDTPAQPPPTAQPKKRGRPSRADIAKRHLHPNLPPRLAPRLEQGFGYKPTLPAAPRQASHSAQPPASIFSTGDGRQNKKRRLAILEGENEQSNPKISSPPPPNADVKIYARYPYIPNRRQVAISLPPRVAAQPQKRSRPFHSSEADSNLQGSVFNSDARSKHNPTEQGETFQYSTDSDCTPLPIQGAQAAGTNANEGSHFKDVDANSQSFPDNNDQSTDDADSTCPEDFKIPTFNNEAYSSSLAHNLLNEAFTEKLDKKGIDRIYSALPQLIKIFVVRVGSSDTMPIYRNVMAFVHRCRSEIDKTMKDTYIEGSSIPSNTFENYDAGIVSGEPVSKWTNTAEDLSSAHSETQDDVTDDGHYQEGNEADQAAGSRPMLSVYKDFLSKLSGYKWLLESIRKTLYMGVPGKVQTNIRDSILEYLPRAQGVSRGIVPQRYSLTFIADWNPCLFLQEQGYLESPETAVERAITVTGSITDAQAATTMQYLSQTWPSSGSHLLHVVKHVVQDVSQVPYSHNLPDGTQLIVCSGEPLFKLEVVGTAESIAEIGEQLAWLGSALRSSPYPTGIASVNAFLGGLQTSSSNEINERPTSMYFCNIGFNLNAVDDADVGSNGQSGIGYSEIQ